MKERGREVKEGGKTYPWSMAPGEQDDVEFGQDVGVGDVEVVFKLGDVDVAVELEEREEWVNLRAFCLSFTPFPPPVP